ncbi:MAG: insulinase family protein [Firmicutes bacterium]|nr:insulinase family protein [Bacillota bacterium]
MKEIKIKGTGEVIYEHICKNGLTIYIWQYNLSEEANLTLTVKYGSVHTKFKSNGKDIMVPNGMAHFLEHIKFNEKKDSTAHDFFYKIGSYSNAYTTYDHTSYEVVCNNNLKENIEHLLYFVLNPYFTKGLIQKEKGIIVEESKMTLNNPYNLGYKALMNGLYKANNKRHLITGEKDDIKSITIDDVVNVFDNFYHPKNMFLTVTGNVNPYEVVKIVDEYFENEDTPMYLNPEIILPKEPDNVAKGSQEIATTVTKEKLLLSIKIPKKQYKNISDLNLRILFNIIMDINFGTTSELNEHLIQNALVDDIYYMVTVEENHIVLTFESSTSYPKQIVKIIKEKINSLEFDEESFNRKNKTLIAASILGYEDATDVNNDIRADIIKYGKIINNIQDVFKGLKVLDGENIINKLKKYEISYVILKPNASKKS